MKYRNFIIAIFTLFSITNTFAQQFRQASSTISFFSSAPMEDIFAESKKCISAIDAGKKTIALIIYPKDFVFKNPIMQEHFNENYMESDKFPKATFTGKIVGDFDVTKDGEYPVKVVGKLSIHGVEKAREIEGKIIVKNGVISIASKFAVKLSEHNIEIPSIMTKKIAEVVELNISVTYK